MEIISTIALISINETLIVQVISFLIFLFVINRIMFRPLRNVMSDREEHIDRVMMDISEAREKIASIDGQIKDQEIAVKKEGWQLKKDLEETGKQQAKEIFSAARKEIAATGGKVQKDIDTQIAQARKSIQKEAETLAAGIVSKILDRRPQS